MMIRCSLGRLPTTEAMTVTMTTMMMWGGQGMMLVMIRGDRGSLLGGIMANITMMMMTIRFGREWTLVLMIRGGHVWTLMTMIRGGHGWTLMTMIRGGHGWTLMTMIRGGHGGTLMTMIRGGHGWTLMTMIRGGSSSSKREKISLIQMSSQTKESVGGMQKWERGMMQEGPRRGWGMSEAVLR